jgi:hypothetical protein
MNLGEHDFPDLPRLEIPRLFRNSDTDGLFQSCLVCERSLLDGQTPYLIEKAIRRYPRFETEDVVFEYALCMQCYQDVAQRMSNESMVKLQQFVERQASLAERSERLLEEAPDNHAPWVQSCMVTGKPIAECTEYTVCAHALGDHLLLGVMPYAMSGEALDQMIDLLSYATQDALNDFRDNHIGGPPEWEDLLNRKPRPVLV